MPRTWVLLGPKAGDNNQMLALAEALPWQCETRTLVFHARELLANLALRVTLAGVDLARSSPLLPPWPDLVIAGGRRQEPVARWIQRQSGGHARLVHVGRPWTAPRLFDLVIVTPQYRLPVAANIVGIDLPLHRITRARLADAAGEWAPRLAHLPRPHLTVLVGGNSGPYRLTNARARALVELVRAHLAAHGGSALVATSARTPRAVADFLADALPQPHRLFAWHAPGDDANPYLGFLGLADALIVTGDSASMLAEAAVTGAPLVIFDLDRPPRTVADYLAWKPLTHRLVQRLLPERFHRDIGRLHATLCDSGRARLDHGAPPAASAGAPSGATAAAGVAPPPDDVARAAARVVALMA
jgi:hypothetical protein